MNRALIIKISKNKGLDAVQIDDELEKYGFEPLNKSELGAMAIEEEKEEAEEKAEYESKQVKRTYDAEIRKKLLAEGKTFHGLPRHIQICLSLPSDLLKDLKANCKSISGYVTYLVRQDIARQLKEGGEWKG